MISVYGGGQQQGRTQGLIPVTSFASDARSSLAGYPSALNANGVALLKRTPKLSNIKQGGHVVPVGVVVIEDRPNF